MDNATLGCHGQMSPEIRLEARKRPLFMRKKLARDGELTNLQIRAIQY